MIQKQRIKLLNSKKTKRGKFVLYWMQASQRQEQNHALEYSIMQANELGKPVVVFFGITDNFPEANLRHYQFMLEGLKEVQSSLQKRGIKMVIRHTSPERGAVEISENACLAVVDRGYLRIQRNWRKYAASHMSCPLIQVESDVLVPVEEASPQEEYSAATFRPKINRVLKDYIVPLKKHALKIDSLNMNIDSINLHDLKKVISGMKIDRSVNPVESFHGGTNQAKKHLADFLKNKLKYFHKLRNDPTQDFLSNLSLYLHFGQISPLYIALEVQKTKNPGKEVFLEELLIRRELCVNFTFYNWKYDSFDGLPQWAKKTLWEHKKDKRDYLYTLEELENAKTHDPYWNAAQQEMRIKGKMHGYMRMYWGKKILEWTKTPEKAFGIALLFNNKYELDGRDPNGFTGVAWCFGKHDRPWMERKIFGKIRYMNANGLKRKFDADLYVRNIEKLEKPEKKVRS